MPSSRYTVQTHPNGEPPCGMIEFLNGLDPKRWEGRPTFTADEDRPDYWYHDGLTSWDCQDAFAQLSYHFQDVAFEVDWMDDDLEEHWVKVFHIGEVIWSWHLKRPELRVEFLSLQVCRVKVL